MRLNLLGVRVVGGPQANQGAVQSLVCPIPAPVTPSVTLDFSLSEWPGSATVPSPQNYGQVPLPVCVTGKGSAARSSGAREGGQADTPSARPIAPAAVAHRITAHTHVQGPVA